MYVMHVVSTDVGHAGRDLGAGRWGGRGLGQSQAAGRPCLGPIDVAVEAAETRERCQVSADAHGEMKVSEKRPGVRPRKTGGREDFQEGQDKRC